MHQINARVVTICLCLGTVPAFAQQVSTLTGYPDRPVRVIVPVATGGGTDIIARIISTKLSEAFGKSFVVDNRAGGGGILGTEIVAKSIPDGYTLLSTYAGHTIVPFIYEKVPYNVYKDFAPITLVASQPLLLAVNSSIGVNSVAELIALAKAKPGRLNVALATASSSGSLAAEIFKLVTGTKIISVPYKGGGFAMTALIAGETQLTFTTPPSVMPFLKSGKVKIIGISGKDRVAYLPDVPTLAEAGIKDFNTAPWQGLMAPAKTPGNIIDKLYKQVAEILKLPYTRERFAATGSETVGSSPKEFALQITRELEQNSKAIKAVGMKAD